MKLPTAFISLILILTPVAGIGDETVNGWGKVVWGMTPQQVKATYGNQLIETPSDSGKEHFYPFTLKGIVIADASFQAAFKFDKKTNKLVGVFLWLENPGNELLLYDKIHSLLLKKYGEPIESKKNKIHDTLMGLAKWKKDKTFIELNLGYTKPEDRNHFVITYDSTLIGTDNL